MKLDGKHAIVVGGATGGSIAALLLSRAGARVTILERVLEPRAVGAGIALAENGLAVLGALGLGDAVASHGCAIEGVRVVDGLGRALLVPRGPQPRGLMMRRSDLQSVLEEAVRRAPRVDRVVGAEVVDADADGNVSVRRRDAGGETRTMRGDLVIGADGLRSRVREAGDFGARVGRPIGRYVRALVGVGLARSEEAWTREGLFGSFAVPGGTYVYASASGPAGRAIDSRGDLRAWKEAWSEAYAPARDILAGIVGWDQLLVNDVVRVDCARFFDGRLVLLGDAAHAMAPNLGQGANSAIVDAAVLAWALRRSEDLPSALAAYDARRRPSVRVVSDRAARLGALAGWTSAPARFVRDRLLLPVAERFADERAMRVVMQEPAHELAQMCAAA